MPTATAPARNRTRAAQTPPRTVRPRASSRRVSTVTIREAIIQVLGASRVPLGTKEITTRVQDMRGVNLGGSTPAATVAAILSTSHKKRGVFRRVSPGTYTLRRKPGRKPRIAA